MRAPANKDSGTAFTINEASVQEKPYLIIDISQSEEENLFNIQEFIKQNDIKVLNVAGPRESIIMVFIKKFLIFLNILFNN
ncbi:YpsA SLOG family protein [Legionella beliardensis]|uniref:YpsA SLOG family protein n=1 Tax=Legionella beliardensis TaxID=91822 RepID=UPI00135AFCDD